MNQPVKDERLFAVTGTFNFNAILSILRKQHPGETWDDMPEQGQDLSKVEPYREGRDAARRGLWVLLHGGRTECEG